jgi:hypothetical protein
MEYMSASLNFTRQLIMGGFQPEVKGDSIVKQGQEFSCPNFGYAREQ